ncbi:hypothetical protein NQD34_016084, partial [Periophthalmus magnuspinnatus]
SDPRIVKDSTEVQIKCHHDDSGMNVMLWYKQLHDGQMKLIVYSYTVGHPAFEKDFKKRFAMRRTDIQTGALIISNVEPNDSATYFCAASTHIPLNCLIFSEPNIYITEPKVKIFKPSEKEGPRSRTLVCVASGFYPDHVTVTWLINGDKAENGVSTDSVPQRKDKYYTITSRLMIPREKWYNPTNTFKCNVLFF